MLVRLCVGLFLILCSCQVGPSYAPPTTYAPETWKHQEQPLSEISECPARWWEVFDDPLLDQLEQSALENNHSLFAAVERVIQARALAGVAEANLYPQLTLTPYFTNEEVLSRLFRARNAPKPKPPFLREHQRTYALPLNLSYEFDFWGLVRNTYKSALFRAEAEAFALQTAILILTTDLADTYFQLKTYDTLVELYVKTIDTRQNALEINRARYDSRMIDYSAVSRAQLDLSNAEADYYHAKQQRDLLENRIAVLIGVPANIFCLPSNPLDHRPPSIPPSMPSAVLLQRPDIAQAERTMASQHALVNVAYASFFPDVTITGILGFSSPDMKQFLSWHSRFWEIGAQAVQTIFDGGEKCSNLNLAWARFHEADQNYQQAVLVAFQEVEDALASIEWLYYRAQMLADAVEAAKTTYQIAWDRYIEGVTFYLDVTDSERDELTAEREWITVQGSRFSATIQLIKALGGSWNYKEFYEQCLSLSPGD